MPPVYSFSTSPDHALGFSIFIGLCVLLTEFGAGRRRVEHALRVNEERFRTLVQFSFDVYWETDARHRFTRQEFSANLTDAPARGSEIGKTRWECRTSSRRGGWRQHRETLDAHLPFRDFELARPTPDGGKRYVPFPECRCSTKTDASSATAAWAVISPSSSAPRRSAGSMCSSEAGAFTRE